MLADLKYRILCASNGTIRISVGTEDPEGLLADFEQALS